MNVTVVSCIFNSNPKVLLPKPIGVIVPMPISDIKKSADRKPARRAAERAERSGESHFFGVGDPIVGDFMVNEPQPVFRPQMPRAPGSLEDPHAETPPGLPPFGLPPP